MATRSKTVKVKGVSINGLTTRQQQAMKKHAKHHTAKHLKDMKTRMSKGASFTTAHKQAMKKVGK